MVTVWGRQPIWPRMKSIFLWIVCIPAGAIGGFLVWIVFSFVARLSTRYVKPNSMGDYIVNVLPGGFLSGMAAIYITAYIAPSKKKWVSMTMALLAIAGMIVALPIMVENNDWSYLLFLIAQDAGIIFMTYKIFKNEITF